ncbi:MAG: 3-oxoacyl-ACP reductase FabG, partial [Lentisphaeria bacterium]|nr:3-oxoacyl-ACP reductase FabG [Lentisphaeria bacterium]
MSSDAYLFKMPKLYENMDEGTIGKWLVAEGDTVEKGQTIVEFITDKTNEDFEAPEAGKILKIYTPEKSVLAVGYTLAAIGGDGDTFPDTVSEEKASKKTTSKEKAPIATAEISQTQKMRLAPAARAFAKKNDLSIDEISSHFGLDTVVHKKDLEKYLATKGDSGSGDSTDNPLALITGASGDIGRAIALELAKQGFDIAYHFNSNKDAAVETGKQIGESGKRAKAYQADLRDSTAAQKFIKNVHADFGHIDVLVNNTGKLDDAPLSFMSDEQWQDALDTNLNSTFFCCRAVAMIMARQRQGKIINISSDAGRMGGAGRSNYAAAKAAISGFTKSIARELAGSNIQVNTVSPGFVESEMTASIKEKKKKDLMREIPARRFAEAEEIAHLVAFLASDKANYITGQEISINGG